jgi:hypothetical protein
MAVAHLKYKVAAVQAAPAFLDLEGSVEKTIRLIRRNWPLAAAMFVVAR